MPTSVRHITEPIYLGLRREAHRPTPLPDRIILTWQGDPATSMSVTWRTDTSVKRGLAQIAAAEDGPDFRADKIRATTTLFRSDLSEAHVLTTRFTSPT